MLPSPMPRTPHPSRDRKPAFNASSLHKLFHIHQRLSAGRPATAKSLAAELATSVSTIKRILDTMINELGAPIEWDGPTNTWLYTRPCDVLPLVKLSSQQALALAVAAHAFAAWDSIPFGDSLTSALEALEPLIGGAVSFPLAELRKALSAPPTAPVAELRHMERLIDAILHQRVLRFHYRKPTDQHFKRRTAHPLLITPLNRRWTLIAVEPETGELRSFQLLRMRDPEATRQTFTRPADLDLAKFLRGCMGRYTGKGEHVVRIAFTAIGARYFREEPWHTSWKKRRLPDGRTEITMRLNNLVDVTRRILHQGENAEALAPVELRTAVHTTLQSALARYA